MNEDFTLTTFAEPITDLADEPQLPADEMKRRLQAPADELREAHNALAQTVHGITDATYPDTVTESMLTDELAAKINGKADADDVTALDDRLDTVETALPAKCEIYLGTYTGDGGTNTSKTISIGFTPRAVLIFGEDGKTCTGFNYYTHTGGLVMENAPVVGPDDDIVIEIVTNGFKVYNHSYSNNDHVTANSGKHYFIAFY